MTDREKFLEQARKYIGVNGDYVCNKKLGLGVVVDWCAYSISAIMNDCGFIGKYQGGIYGFASDAAREDSGKLGEWFRKGEKTPQPGDYIMFRYASFTNPIDKFSASHVGIVEAVNGDVMTTLEGNVDGYGYNWAETSCFKRKTRYLANPDVYAFYRPFWQASKSTGSQTKTKTGSQPKDKISQIYSSQAVNFDVRVKSDDGVNIRSGAGTSYPILGAIPCGCTAHISRITSDKKYSWGLTDYEGVKGWIALNYTQKCSNKSVEELAKEVIQGKWSVGDERERLLHQAGYDYQAVQNKVNEILK